LNFLKTAFFHVPRGTVVEQEGFNGVVSGLSLTFTFSQTNPWTTAVFIDEDDAGGF
jgi:hypothetical protein